MISRSRRIELISELGRERLVEASRRLLLSGGYPNPDRVACPRNDVLKAIALRKMALRDADEYVFHMGICSPCFVEYTAFRKQAQRRKMLNLILACAMLLAVVAAPAWLWSHQA